MPFQVDGSASSSTVLTLPGLELSWGREGSLLKVHILGSHPRLCILTSKYCSYRITALGWRTRKLGRTFYGLHLSANNLFGIFISGLSGLVVKLCLTLVIHGL